MKPRMAEEAFIIPADEPSGSGLVSSSPVDPLPSVSPTASATISATASATISSAAASTASSVCLRLLLRFGVFSLPANSTGTEISENILWFRHWHLKHSLSYGPIYDMDQQLTTGENLISWCQLKDWNKTSQLHLKYWNLFLIKIFLKINLF